MLRFPVASFFVAVTAIISVVGVTASAQTVPFNASFTTYESSSPTTHPPSNAVGTSVVLDPMDKSDFSMRVTSLPGMWVHPILRAWCDFENETLLTYLRETLGYDWVFGPQLTQNPTSFDAAVLTYPVATSTTTDHELHVTTLALRGLHDVLPWAPGLERGLFQPVIAASGSPTDFTTPALRTWVQNATTWINNGSTTTIEYWDSLASKEDQYPDRFASDSILFDVLEQQYRALHPEGDAQAALKAFANDKITDGLYFDNQTVLEMALDMGLHLDVQFVGFRRNSVPSGAGESANSESLIFNFSSAAYNSSVYFSNTCTLSFGRISNIMPPFSNPQSIVFPGLDYVRSAGTSAPLGGYALIRLTGVLGGTIVTWKDVAGTTFTAELEYVEPGVWGFPISSNAATGGGFIVKIERPGSILTGGRFTPWAQLSILQP